MGKATTEQLKIAKKFHIPVRQAHTINLKKVEEYERYLESPEASLQKFLDEIGEQA